MTMPGSDKSAAVVDVAQFIASRAKSVAFIRELLASTAAATPHFGCFGLHEWAMVYREDEHRHLGWPLRLGRRPVL